MTPETITQLGFGGASLLVIWLIVKYFMETLTSKDEYLKGIVKDFNATMTSFNTTVSNHMDHQTTAFKELTKTINLLIEKKTTPE